MSQEELAKKVGYGDRSSIAKIENGKVDLPQSQIFKIANALGVNPGDLMGFDGVSTAGSTPKQDDVKLSDRAVQIGMAYDRADERTKIGVEVALGIDFEKESVNPTSSSSTLSA